MTVKYAGLHRRCCHIVEPLWTPRSPALVSFVWYKQHWVCYYFCSLVSTLIVVPLCVSLSGASSHPSDSGPGHSSMHPTGAVLLHCLHPQAAPQQALRPAHHHLWLVTAVPHSTTANAHTTLTGVLQHVVNQRASWMKAYPSISRQPYRWISVTVNTQRLFISSQRCDRVYPGGVQSLCAVWQCLTNDPCEMDDDASEMKAPGKSLSCGRLCSFSRMKLCYINQLWAVEDKVFNFLMWHSRSYICPTVWLHSWHVTFTLTLRLLPPVCLALAAISRYSVIKKQIRFTAHNSQFH